MRFLQRYLVMIAVTAALPISAAHAYLAAASASLALQAIIGTFAAYILTAKIYWRKIKALLTRKKPAEADSISPID